MDNLRPEKVDDGEPTLVARSSNAQRGTTSSRPPVAPDQLRGRWGRGLDLEARNQRQR